MFEAPTEGCRSQFDYDTSTHRHNKEGPMGALLIINYEVTDLAASKPFHAQIVPTI